MKYFLSFVMSVFVMNISAQESYVVTIPTLNVREQKSTSSKVLFTLKKGDVVGITDTTNEQWWKIQYYDKSGYVSSKYIVEAGNSEEFNLYERLNANTGDNYDCENIIPEYDKQYDNELRIKMGYISDGVVKLMNKQQVCIRIAYVKAGDTFSMKNIPLGNYTLRIAYGRDLRRYVSDGNCIVRFLQDPSYKEGNQILAFEKVLDERRSNYITGNMYYNLASYELQLNALDASKGVKGQKLTTDKISEKRFNQ